MKLARTGTPITSQRMMAGVIHCSGFYGDYRRARANEHPLKKVLRNSRRRKAPITLPSTPWDKRP